MWIIAAALFTIAIILFLTACGPSHSSTASAAKAKASAAASAARNNPAVQADLNAANSCAVHALNPGQAHPITTFRGCMTTVFPPGGSRKIALCVGREFALNYLKGKAAVKAAITKNCESIR
jgi:hypothetical protein